MRLYRIKPFHLLTVLVATVLLTSLTLGQERWDELNRRSNGVGSASDGDPTTALLNQRRAQLTDRLRHLRRAEATMGPKHPSLLEVRAQIAEVRQELAAWSSDGAAYAVSEEGFVPNSLPALDNDDLRLLVLRLATKIENLESRVSALERTRTIH